MLRVYLDTSVFSAYYDDRTPDRREQTRSFWEQRESFEITTSELARQEAAQTPDPETRQRLAAMLEESAVHPVSDEARDLARRYVQAGVFGSAMINDALHVAVAVLTRADVLVSWNFKHLVNRRRRAQINDLNISWGIATIEIVAPPEI